MKRSESRILTSHSGSMFPSPNDDHTVLGCELRPLPGGKIVMPGVDHTHPSSSTLR